jgi:nitroimidazol reductase NimA-like FMN-containing flavoprotein (pyridoxamine 5'-phosphate oxidase superfamily)
MKGSGAPTPRTEVRRLAERGVYDREVIESIIDEALICHVGIVHDGHPAVIPTIHARVGNTLYLHGSPAARVLRDLKSGSEVCVAVSLIDGLVVARTPFHNSMNYRSVIVYGQPRLVDDPVEKAEAFRAITEHVLPGRWEDSRPPNDKETRGTLIVALGLDEASAKVRTGGPKDDAEDHALGFWAGVIPVETRFGDPIDDELLEGDAPVPGYISDYRRPVRDV